MTGEVLTTSLDDGVLTVTMNRADSLNAINGELHQSLVEVFTELKDRKDVRSVLLRGEGRAFCVGGDVKMMSDTPAPKGPVERVESVLDGKAMLHAHLAVPQPVVAAVQGYAMGLGSTIALTCDVVVAAKSAVFADTHVNVGLVAGDGGAALWPLLMSLGKAKYYLMTGDRLSGEEAERLGLVFKAVEDDTLQTEALAVARRLAEVPPLASAGTKATLNLILQDRLRLVLEYGLLREGLTFLSEDHQEAAAAFVEKRKPRFTGR